MLLRTVARVGLEVPRLRRVCLEEREASIFQTLREVFGREDLCFAVSLGTPGPHRKPVIQVMSLRGEVLGYAKVGWNEATKELVNNESRVLQSLGQRHLPFRIPTVLYANNDGNWSVCIQAPPPSNVQPAPRGLQGEYITALCAFAAMGVERQALEETLFWQRIVTRVQNVQSAYWRQLLTRMLQTVLEQWQCKKVPLHLAHGDFTPWNALQVDGRLYLYDWEYSLNPVPAAYDLFHFLVQTGWLVEGRKPRDILRMVLEQSREPRLQGYWEQAGVRDGEIAPLFHLYLLNRLSLPCLRERDIADKPGFLALLNWSVKRS
jgi:hypothetical protein